MCFTLSKIEMCPCIDKYLKKKPSKLNEVKDISSVSISTILQNKKTLHSNMILPLTKIAGFQRISLNVG